MNEEQEKSSRWDKPLSTLFAIVLSGVTAFGISENIHRSRMRILEALERNVQQIQIKTENVVGGPAPDKFYNTAHGRAYLEIDGKPVEQYFSAEVERK